eukprot:CAMPEP_0113877004 /NCGR_PEP_ID=MMETSP0780_2-20120614/5829_1 /TAXON_ID=652834 /ORGANISM="Palpitomonas bilix" /LENGTH=555 /DNA_ID=CAMNT_0000863201 /DNA_START=203 /DNA_END=1870 /DNA_ORIENTATION=+ /assembly_acc=CAM_ASM_000599
MLEEFLVRSDCATGIVRADFERTDIFRRLVHLRDKEEYSEEEQLELTCLERVWTLKGQYPVLSICFSGKHGVESIKSAIMVVAKKYDVLLSTSSRLNEAERKDFHRIATGKTKAWDQSILLLTYYISKHFGSQVVLLIDEYDSFLDLDFENGLGERVRSFVQGVLCVGLKNNPHVDYCVVAGVTRFIKNGLLSGLNSMNVNDIISPGNLACAFGFTEADVLLLLKNCRGPKKIGLKELRKWYNGYLIGGQKIYNPWSVMSALKNKSTGSYWSETSSVDRITKTMMLRSDLLSAMSKLYSLRGYHVKLSRDVCTQSLETLPGDSKSRRDIFWYTLLQAGCLGLAKSKSDSLLHLKIPNRDMKRSFKQIMRRIGSGIEGLETNDCLHKFVKGGAVCHLMLAIKKVVMSSSFKSLTSEQSYHNVLFGMLFNGLKKWVVYTEAESGHGFLDLGLVPPPCSSLTAIILELKHYKESKHHNESKKKEALSSMAKDALQQICDKRYDYLLNTYEHIREFRFIGICFSGKDFEYESLLVNPKKGIKRKEREAASSRENKKKKK